MGSQAPKCYVESGPRGSIEIPIVITGKTSIKALDCVNHFHIYLLVPTWLIYNSLQVLLRAKSDTFKSFGIQLYTYQNFEQNLKYFSKTLLMIACISRYMSTPKTSSIHLCKVIFLLQNHYLRFSMLHAIKNLKNYCGLFSLRL